MITLITVVDRQTQASQCQEEQIKKPHEFIAQQVGVAQISQDSTTYPLYEMPLRALWWRSCLFWHTLHCWGLQGWRPQDESDTSAAEHIAIDAEQEQAWASIANFKKFNPLTYNGESIDPWVVETLVDSTEKLFNDLYILDRDKVYLAAHCLDKVTHRQWKTESANLSTNLPPSIQEKFQGLIFNAFFPNKIKQQLEDFENLRHGNRTVLETVV